MGTKALRIEAIELAGSDVLKRCWDGGSAKCAGQLGCQASHLLALSYAQRMRWDEVAIFEDDFVLKPEIDPALVQPAIRNIKEKVPDWDVIALSLNIQKQTFVQKFKNERLRVGDNSTVQLMRVAKALTTHGYMIKSHMIPILMKSFSECDVAGDLWVAIDTCWQPLQLQHKWYALYPQLGTQADSFSDIEQQNVSYHIS